MHQALKIALPEHEISAHVALEEADPKTVPSLLLIDIPAIDLRTRFAALRWSCREMVCILTGASKPEGSDRFIRLPRPFTEKMLISTTLNALGCREDS